MSKRKNKGQYKKHKHHHHHKGLSGIAQSIDGAKVGKAFKQAGLLLATAAVSGIAGAAIGRHSLAVGIPVALAGAYKDNKYLMAAGMGMIMSNGFQTGQSSTTNGVDGFDMKQVMQGAKDRVSKYFENFKDKLYLPSTPAPDTISTTDGLLGEDNVKYFVNPYSPKEPDLSELDHMEDQIANMNQGTNGLFAIDREL